MTEYEKLFRNITKNRYNPEQQKQLADEQEQKKGMIIEIADKILGYEETERQSLLHLAQRLIRGQDSMECPINNRTWNKLGMSGRFIIKNLMRAEQNEIALLKKEWNRRQKSLGGKNTL